MDYPKSVPSVGLVNGKFVDENPVTGTPGSLVPAAWGNAVTQEILSILGAAGITPSETENDQLLKAIRGKFLFVTEPQFAATKAAATTEFVQRALGSFAGGRGVSGSEVLTGADIGKRLELSAGVTVTLPASSSVPNGSAILISAGPVSLTSRVTVAAGDQLAMNNLAVAVPYLLAAGGDFLVIREGNVWRCHLGSETLRTASVFAAIFGPDANQVLPSGWTFKIGHASTSGSAGTVPITFPVAFPTACMYVGAIYAGGGSATNPSLCQSGIPSRTGFTGYLTNVAGNNAAVTSGGYNWLAIGY
ncbi:gp53-like domain-containing protein [Pseudomonas sp. LB3P38]|uniref:gp53-like domain-containing protein n=1 Tax=Pseudomonas lyxosi TaxID=3398358 RepID=UPI0039EF5810